MRRSINKLLAVGLIMGAILSCTPHVEAASTKTMTINALGDGYKYTVEKRTKKYSYVKAKCFYVHPYGNYSTDNFKKIRVKIFKYQDNKKTPISKPTDDSYNNYVLTEGQGYSKIYLKDNCMNINYAYFGWCGNSTNYNAETKVGYDAM